MNFFKDINVQYLIFFIYIYKTGVLYIVVIMSIYSNLDLSYYFTRG